MITNFPSARCVSTNLLVVIAATNTAATNERDIITNATRNFMAVGAPCARALVQSVTHRAAGLQPLVFQRRFNIRNRVITGGIGHNLPRQVPQPLPRRRTV
jgi:hypothetical protein